MRSKWSWLWNLDDARERPVASLLFMVVSLALAGLVQGYLRSGENVAAAALGATIGAVVAATAGWQVLTKPSHRQSEKEQRFVWSRWRGLVFFCAISAGFIAYGLYVDQWEVIISALPFALIGAVIFAVRSRYGIAAECLRPGVRPAAGAALGRGWLYATDGLGSVVDLSDARGGKLVTYDWDPYGQGGASGRASNKAPANPLGFMGAYTDAATKLVDLRARQHDSSTGRFLSPDPLDQYQAPTAATDPYASFQLSSVLRWYELCGRAARWEIQGWQRLR